MFMFVFLINVLGMIPFLGSATADLQVTLALALVCFGVIHVTGVREHGVPKYLATFIPHIEVDNPFIRWPLVIGMAALEYLTAFIRVIILAVRLFANMLAGHTASVRAVAVHQNGLGNRSGSPTFKPQSGLIGASCR